MQEPIKFSFCLAWITRRSLPICALGADFEGDELIVIATGLSRHKPSTEQSQ